MSNYTSAYTTPQLGAGEFDSPTIPDDGVITDTETNGDDELDTLPPVPLSSHSNTHKSHRSDNSTQGPGQNGHAGGNNVDDDDGILGPVTYRQTLKLHLHHYQIFLYLALFTRYPTPWSRVASGLALGAACHGVAAYGCDSVFEWVEDTG